MTASDSDTDIQSIWRTYFIAFGLFAVCIVATFLVALNENSTESSFDTVINLSGRQRMLSQRIIVLASEFSSAQQVSEDLELELRETLKQFSATHKALKEGDSTLGISALSSEQELALYAQLDPAFLKLTENISKLLESDAPARHEYLAAAARASNNFLPLMDKLVFLLTERASQTSSQFTELHQLLLAGQMFLLLLCTWFLVKPMIERLRDSKDNQARTLQKFKDSEERFQLALKGSNDGFWDWDLPGNKVYYSERMLELLGYRADNFPGHFDSFANIIHPEDSPAALAGLKEHLETGGLYDVELRCKAESGEYNWFRFRGEAIRDEHGAAIRMAGSLTDINLSRLEREKLQSTTRRLNLALEVTATGLWDWNLVSNETYFNDSWYTMLGYQPGELPMNLDTWKELCHPEDLPRAMDEIASYMSGQKAIYRCDHRLKCKDGSWMWIEDVGKIVEHDQVGNPVRMIGVHIDIEEQKEREASVRSERERFQLFIQKTPAAVAIFDNQMRYLMASDYWLKSYKLGDLDIIGKSHYEIFPDIPQNWKDIHQRCLKGEVMSCAQDSFKREDGCTEWIKWDLHPWYHADGSIGGLIMFTELITEKIEKDRQIIAARNEAIQASKAKSEFLANMSHEIRTPMNGVLGMTELLLDTALTTDQRDLASTAYRSAKSLLTVINDILDFSKIEAGKIELSPVAFNLDTFFQELEALHRIRFEEKSLSFIWSIGDSVPRELSADADRLRQVLVNLIGNALKFTPAGGAIILRVEKASEIGDSVKLQFTVADTGIGVPPDKQQRIFNAFEQADSSTTRMYGGTGLGLSISARLVALMGGEIGLKSEEGKGTAFYFTADFQKSLQIADSNQARNLSLEVNLPAALKVLVAEDNTVNQKLIRRILENMGCQVILAQNGKEAVELFQQREFDLILMDMQMPVMGGEEAVSLIRGLQSEGRIPIVALTAHSMSGDREKYLAQGMDGYVSKPINRQELFSTMSELLQQK